MKKQIFSLVVLICLFFTVKSFAGIPNPPQIACDEPCEVTGAELQNFSNQALLNANVQELKNILESFGYYYVPVNNYGEKQDRVIFSPDSIQPYAVFIALAFSIENNNPQRSAYIIWGFSENNNDTLVTAAEIYFGAECPYPSFTEVASETWSHNIYTQSQLGSGNTLRPNKFWDCWWGNTKRYCAGCVALCLLSNCTYLHCLGVCCLGSSSAIGLGCLIDSIF